MLVIKGSTSLKSILSALLLLTLLAASPVMAGENKADDFDANGDGQVTFEEVMKRLESSARTAFDSMDRNKDGVLSEKDFNDISEGMEKLQRWLDDLLKPFLPEKEPERMEV